jgi:hypothetical protein
LRNDVYLLSFDKCNWEVLSEQNDFVSTIFTLTSSSDTEDQLKMSFFKAVPKHLLTIAQELASDESKLSIMAAVVFEDGTPDRLRDDFDAKLQKWAKDCAQVSSTDFDDGSKQEIYESALRWLQTSENRGFPHHSEIFETLLNNVACCYMRQRDWGRALAVLSSAFKAAKLASEALSSDQEHDPSMLLNLAECLYEVNQQDEADNVLLAVLGTLEAKTPEYRDFDFLIALSTAYHNFSKRILLRSDIRDHHLAFQCLSAAQALSEVCSGMTVDSSKILTHQVLNTIGQDIRLVKEQVRAKMKEHECQQFQRKKTTIELGIGTFVPGFSSRHISSLVEIPKRVPLKFKQAGLLPNVNLDLALSRFRASNRDREWSMQTSLDAWHSRLKSQIEAVTVHPSQFMRSTSAPFN